MKRVSVFKDKKVIISTLKLHRRHNFENDLLKSDWHLFYKRIINIQRSKVSVVYTNWFG